MTEESQEESLGSIEGKLPVESTYDAYSMRLAVERIRMLAPLAGIAFVLMQLRVPFLYPYVGYDEGISAAAGRLLMAAFLIFGVRPLVWLPVVMRHLRSWIAVLFIVIVYGQGQWIMSTGGIESPAFAYFPVMIMGWMIVTPGGVRENLPVCLGLMLFHFLHLSWGTRTPLSDPRLYQHLNYMPELTMLTLAGIYIIDRHRREEYESKRIVMQQNEILGRSAYFDSLTAIGNRRYFDERFREKFEIARRHNRPLSLMMLDVDRFKDVNDSLGHQAGDFLLAETAAILRTLIRSGDVLARYGGDEFVIVLPETDLAGARLLAERVRQRIEQHVFPFGGHRTRTTVSIGVVEMGPDTLDCEQLHELADQELYRAKRGGRNRVN